MWTKHIHGQPKLVRQLEALSEGQTIRLRINGVSGVWEKMRNRPDGSSTPGLRPVGEVQAFWTELFKKRRGELVDLMLESSAAGEWRHASDEEREAAWSAFKALASAGWRSEAPYGERDELYDR
jgi:hypothetical protein